MEGRARRVGDDVNTDYIIASRRKRDTVDPQALRPFLFEDLEPGLGASLGPGDILVAGKNFGCGSAMEVAVTVVQAAGIRAVVAASFSRTYFRNAINNGLLPVECDSDRIREGDVLRIRTDGELRLENRTTRETLRAVQLPPTVAAIVDAGGLVPYVLRSRTFGDPTR